MHRLFTLIIFTPAFLHAAPGNIAISVGHQNQIQLNEVDTKKDFQRISIVSPTLANHYTLGAQYSFEQNDISTRNLTGSTGQETPLSAIDNGKREIATISVEYRVGMLLASASSSQDTKPSVFSRKSYSLLLQLSPFSGATQLFVSGDFSRQDQPESYFTDPGTLQSRRRLAEIVTQTISIGVEQILTENYRTRLALSEVRQHNYRPRQNKLSWANAVALGSRHTVRADLGVAFENRSESLKDDRGYFYSHWLETQWIYESSLDTFWGIGISNVFEKEDDPRRSVETQIGTDAIGGFFEKRFDAFIAAFKISNAQTNLKDTALSLQGDLKWEF